MFKRILPWLGIILVLLLLVRLYRQSPIAEPLVIYSGRSELLVGPLLRQFSDHTGIPVAIRYGQTSEMVATILEEGARSPAAVILAQEAGALATLSAAGMLQRLPEAVTDSVPSAYRDSEGYWVGLSARARVLAYHPAHVPAERLPEDWEELLDEQWRGRIGWAPANASFQSFVTHLRSTRGEDYARRWLIGMRDNGTRAYARNTPIILAVASGEIDIGLVNHYYLHALQQERPDAVEVRNHYPRNGTILNVSGAGILQTARQPEAALMLLHFLAGPEAQRYFVETTFEYPVIEGLAADAHLPALPISLVVDLGQVADLPGTLRLLQELNIL